MKKLHYKDLFVTHRAFWALERRAKHYYTYMKEVKDWKKWPESVDVFEIEKLLRFVPKWDMHLRVKDPSKVYTIYQDIRPIVTKTKNLKLESTNLDAELKDDISKIFDTIAPCSEKGYESSDCSKILHTILPHLIVMWDLKIREGVLGTETKKVGSQYASEFLPLMQTELREALTICMENRKLTFQDAVVYVRNSCGYETLPKLVDEYNYVIHTKHEEFASYLKEIKKQNKIEDEEYQRLTLKL